MFDVALQNLSDNLDGLFNGSPTTWKSALGKAGQGYNASKQGSDPYTVLGRLDDHTRRLPENQANISDRNAPKGSKPAAVESPDEVEMRWMARLAKFAGISQSTGVKLGGA